MLVSLKLFDHCADDLCRPAEGKSGDQAVKDANGGEQENEEEEDEEETDEEGEEKKEKSGGDNKEKVELVGFKKVQMLVLKVILIYI